jgi:citrate synthase
LATWGVLPGFGHPLYPEGDPRAHLLLRRLHETMGSSRALAVGDAVADAVSARIGQLPNVDFVLAVLTQAARMPTDAGEVIFAVARSAGWLAHALEEYRQPPLRFRPRAAYVGVRPSSSPAPWPASARPARAPR